MNKHSIDRQLGIKKYLNQKNVDKFQDQTTPTHPAYSKGIGSCFYFIIKSYF